MSNENEVYVIEDIHPHDAWYEDRKSYIGKQVKIRHQRVSDFDPNYWFGDFEVVNDIHVGVRSFAGVKLTTTPPKKPFWQKLFTWSW